MLQQRVEADTTCRYRENWDFFRYFLAVARTGSISAAARVLGESQPTVGRKLRELERLLAAKLFDRAKSGLNLTRAGERILAQVEKMDLASATIRDAVHGIDDRPSGKVVLTAPEGFGSTVLAPALPAFLERYPNIDLELLLGTRKVNLANRDADVAVRVGDPVHPSLVGRRIGHVRFAVYASRGYLDAAGAPRSVAELRDHPLIDGTMALGSVAQAEYLRRVAPTARRALRCDSIRVQLEAAEAGHGVAVLPCYLARDRDALVEVMRPDMPRVDAWVLSHADLKDIARVRVTLEFVSGVLRGALE